MDTFEKYIMPEPNSGCWLWTGSVTRHGHGTFHVKRKTVSAHRLAFERFKGRIPDGLYVLHKCDVRCCVNPDHLWVGTQSDNLKDMASKGRSCLGEKNTRAKLTESDVLLIRASSKPYAELAKDYGVHEQLIYQIRKRIIWRHI